MTKPWHNAPWEPREWQRRAVDAVRCVPAGVRPVIRAVTGGGKSIGIAELCFLEEGRTVVVTPSVNLVEQLSGTIKARGLKVGRYYTHEKSTRQQVTVCCNDSLAGLASVVEPPDLIIFDECHKTECDQVLDVILGPRRDDGTRDEARAWTPTRTIGFTATPYRSDTSESLTLFDDLAYDYGPIDAIRDGVVVRWTPVKYDDNPKFSGTAKNLNDACVEMIRSAVGPGVVDASNIADADEFVVALTAAGVRAKSVHSGLHRNTVARRVAELERGELDCIVQVSMLVEGVDLPWLRWLCCRRPVQSRVRFAQYVGRGLRVLDPVKHADHIAKYGEKKRCIIYDPLDLFGKLSISYDAVLGGDIANDDTAFPDLPALELDWTIDEINEELRSGNEPETLRNVPVKVIDPAVSYVRRLHLALQFLGVASLWMDAPDQRSESPTPNQLRRVGKLAWTANQSDVPPEHRRALIIAIHAAQGLDRGTVSDLITCLEVLEYGWPADIEEEVAA